MIAAGATALSQPASDALEGLLIFAAAVWIGGLVAIFVVARDGQWWSGRPLDPYQVYGG